MQVQERRRVRPGLVPVLHRLVRVRADDAGVPAGEGRAVRHRGDVHGHERDVSAGRVLAEREELWVGRVGVCEWAVYFALS